MSQITKDRPPIRQKRPNRINPRILLLALGMFALGTDAYIVAGVFPLIVQEMGVKEALAGQLVTAFSLAYGLGSPLLAALVSRWSPHRMLMGALGLFCLANVASALAPTFPILLLIWLGALPRSMDHWPTWLAHHSRHHRSVGRHWRSSLLV